MNNTFHIRPLRPEEYPLLKHFLYLAIHVPEGQTPPPVSILDKPELDIYIRAFGTQKDDIAFAAERDGTVKGILWTRIMDDYGHVSDDIPSLALSVEADARGEGIGTGLTAAMLNALEARGYPAVSLSVQKTNRAQHLYRRAGFETIKETEEEYIMIKHLGGQDLA